MLGRMSHVLGCIVFSMIALGFIPVGAEELSLNFQKAPLAEVIHVISGYVHKNFLMDDHVKGTLTVISDHPVSPQDAYQLFLTALQLNGLRVVERNGFNIIVPEELSSQYALLSSGEAVHSQMIFLAHQSVSRLFHLVQSAMPSIKQLSPLYDYNAFFVTASDDNIQDLLRFIHLLDQPSQNILSVSLKNCFVNDIESVATQFIPPPVHKGYEPVRLISDAVNNIFFIAGGSDIERRDLAKRIRLLDSWHQSQEQRFHVITLKHIRVEQLMPILQGLFSSHTPVSKGGPAALSGQYQQMVSTAPPKKTEETSTGKTTASSIVLSGGRGVVQSDPLSNTLIVDASATVFRSLVSLIHRLDQVRPQVFIEALIVEMNTQKMHEITNQFESLLGLSEQGISHLFGQFAASGPNNILEVLTHPQQVSAGLTAGWASGKVNIPGLGMLPSFSVIGHYLSSLGHANVLSTPTLLTLDQEEAEIMVGQNVPFLTGQFTASSGTNNAPFQTITRQDIGLRLRLMPQVLSDGSISLSIYQEVSSITPIVGQHMPVDIVTNKRSMASHVVLHDRQIVILGGLMEEKFIQQEHKVPLLGDLPILGLLFKNIHRQKVKTNLMIFLRPTIIYNQDDLSRLSFSQYQSVSHSGMREWSHTNWSTPVLFSPAAEELVIPSEYPDDAAILASPFS